MTEGSGVNVFGCDQTGHPLTLKRQFYLWAYGQSPDHVVRTQV